MSYELGRRVLIIAAVAAVVLVLAGAAVAAENGEVWLGNYLLFRMRCPAGGFSPDERAEAIQVRVDRLFEDGDLDAGSVRVDRIGKEAALWANGRLLVTVHECDARANGTTAEKLAKSWGVRLNLIYPKAKPKKAGEAKPHVPV